MIAYLNKIFSSDNNRSKGFLTMNQTIITTHNRRKSYTFSSTFYENLTHYCQESLELDIIILIGESLLYPKVIRIDLVAKTNLTYF